MAINKCDEINGQKCNLRNSKFPEVVQQLFAYHDDPQLNGELKQAAIGGTLIQT